MTWSTSSETLRVLNELVRLNAATASACQFAAAQQQNLRHWRRLLDTGDECFHFTNSLLDRLDQLGVTNELWSEWRPAAAVAPVGHPGLMADNALASVDRQLLRKLAAYDQAIDEPVDRETRELLRRQRTATEAAHRRFDAMRGGAARAEAA